MAKGARFAGSQRDMTRGTWINRGACIDHPSDVFFHITAKPLKTPASVYAEAAAICAECPVREPCADYAIATLQPHGMWGGLTPKQRHNIRYKKQYADPKNRRIHPRKTCMGCARRRQVKFFPDDELSVCSDCLEAEPPAPDPPPKNKGAGAEANRKMPPDDVLRGVLLTDDHDTDELAAKWGVSPKTVARHRQRLRRQFGVSGKRDGVNRKVPSDREMEHLFGLGVRDSTLADEWGVSRRTVLRHKKRLGFSDG